MQLPKVIITEGKQTNTQHQNKSVKKQNIISGCCGGPTVILSTDLSLWCSWHHASTRKFVDLTSTVFDVFSSKKFKVFKVFKVPKKYVCLKLKLSSIATGLFVYLKTGGVLVWGSTRSGAPHWRPLSTVLWQGQSIFITANVYSILYHSSDNLDRSAMGPTFLFV